VLNLTRVTTVFVSFKGFGVFVLHKFYVRTFVVDGLSDNHCFYYRKILKIKKHFRALKHRQILI
jgi:hypothetical protein